MGNQLRERATAQQGQPTLQQLIQRMQPEIAKALPRHMNPDRMARIATTVLKQTPALARCTPESFLGALLTASQLGLEPGPLGECYFVPYGNTVTFIPGYRGLVKLTWQSGQLKSLSAHIVHENDDFEYEYGLAPMLTHKPALSDRGAPIAAYAAALFKDGGSVFEVMSMEDIEKIRRRSKASSNGPWKTDYEAMCRKTVVRQLAKWMPLAPELSDAVSRDGTVRTDIKGELVDVTPTYAEDVAVPAIEAPDGNPDAADGDVPADDTTSPKFDRDNLLSALAAGFADQKLETEADQIEWLSNIVQDRVTTISELTDDELIEAVNTLTGK